jgi:transposase-like protein
MRLAGDRWWISGAHEGLKQALSTVLSGTAWQRCRVHFMRNLLATVPKGPGRPWPRSSAPSLRSRITRRR